MNPRDKVAGASADREVLTLVEVGESLLIQLGGWRGGCVQDVLKPSIKGLLLEDW